MHVPGRWAAVPGMALLRLIPRPRVQVCVLALPRPPTPGLTLGRRGLAPPWDLLSAPFLCMTLYAVSMLQKKKKTKTRKKLNKTTRSGQQRPLRLSAQCRLAVLLLPLRALPLCGRVLPARGAVPSEGLERRRSHPLPGLWKQRHLWTLLGVL